MANDTHSSEAPASRTQYHSLNELGAMLLLFITIFLSALGFFTSFSVTAAIPSLQRDLNVPLDQIQWILSGFAIAQGIFILIAGSLSDRFGRRNILLAGLSLFGVATLLCALAQTAPQLILFRIFQGVGSALLIPQSLAIINTSFAPKLRGQAMGIWGGASGALSLLAPLIGGSVVDFFGWRAVFVVLLPLIGIATILVLKYISSSKHHLNRHIDWLGMAIISASLFILSYGATQLRNSYNLPLAVVSMGSGLALLGAFYFVEKGRENPLVDFKIFRNKEVVAANIFTLLLYTVVSIAPFILTLYLQQLRHHSATQASLEQLPLALTITFLSFMSGKWADKQGAKKVLLVGASLVAVGCVWLSFITATSSYWTVVFPGLILVGLGFGVFVPGLSKAALDVPEEFSGMASGVNNSVAGMAEIFALSVLVGILLLTFHQSLDKKLPGSLSENSARPQMLENSSQLLNLSIPEELSADNKQAAETAIQASFISSAKLQFLILAGLAGMAVVATWIILKR